MKHFLNLTNGIEAIPLLPIGADVAFIRIQSTICEQKDWDRLIMDLDNNFLMSIAIGYTCHVWDFSVHHRPARAVRQGLEFVIFMLEKFWFGNDYNAPNGQSWYFRTIKLSKPAENKLKYFRKFIRTNTIRIISHSDRTCHDGDYQWYVDRINEWNGGPTH